MKTNKLWYIECQCLYRNNMEAFKKGKPFTFNMLPVDSLSVKTRVRISKHAGNSVRLNLALSSKQHCADHQHGIWSNDDVTVMKKKSGDIMKVKRVCPQYTMDVC